jgi:hypothetical protein
MTSIELAVSRALNPPAADAGNGKGTMLLLLDKDDCLHRPVRAMNRGRVESKIGRKACELHHHKFFFSSLVLFYLFFSEI